jgi:hypothetical protein
MALETLPNGMRVSGSAERIAQLLAAAGTTPESAPVDVKVNTGGRPDEEAIILHLLMDDAA